MGVNPATFTITGGADAASFDIVGGNLVFKSARDYETNPHSYQVEVTASDGVNSTPRLITVNLTDVNDNAPVITAAATQSVAENTTFVAALASNDADTVGANPASFAITGGANAALFDIIGGNLVFKTAPDYETGPHSYQVQVTASDGSNATTKLITVGVTNVVGVTINGTSGSNTINATTTVAGQPLPTNEEDIINGAGGNDIINALGGDDLINGGTGADTMAGGAGNDTYVLDNTGDVVIENAGEGTDAIQSSVTYTLSTNVENLSQTGTGNINGTGNALANIIIGNSGNNTLAGLAGADTLDGALGTDTATYVASAAAVNISLATGQSHGGDAEGDTLINIENLTGSGLDDVLEGDGLHGLAGIETLPMPAFEFTDTLTGFENLTGSAWDDILSGSSAANVLAGLDGNDTLNGGGGADTLLGGDGNDFVDGGAGVDTMRGGTGNDTYVVDNTGDLVIENSDEGADTIRSSVTFTLSGNVENLILTGGGNINGTGNAAANVITGNAGNNALAGLAGADVLDGGLGTDTETYAASAAGVNVSLATGLGLGGDAEGDTLINIENLTGSGLDDILEGDSGNNVLTGGTGTNTVSYQHAVSGVTVSLATTGAQNTIGAGTDSLSGFENLIGSAWNDILTGSSAPNVLTGLDGNDTLNGGSSADTLLGGAGNDALVGGAGADFMTGGFGIDRFVFNAVAESSPGAPDVITDFMHGVDLIDLTTIDAATGGGVNNGNQAFGFGGQNSNVVAHSVTWFESNGNTFVQADVNSNSTADVVIVLTGTNLHLTSSDFLL